MGRGRPPKGPELVETIDGSEVARQRVKVVLATIAGELTVDMACAELGIGKTAFHKLRRRVLEAAVEEVEPKPAGRPGRPYSAVQAELDAKRKEMDELLLELQVAHVREEIALVLPEAAAGGQRKKKRPSTSRARTRRRVGKRGPKK